MTDIPMFDCFVILFAREKSHRKKVVHQNVIQWKTFLL